MRIRCPHCHNGIEVVGDDPLGELTCPSCGSSFCLLGPETTVGWEPSVAKSIGHFELVVPLGQGRFGSVWKARDTELDRIVAVKVPRKENLASSEIELFLREARAAAQLKHPDIVPVPGQHAHAPAPGDSR